MTNNENRICFMLDLHKSGSHGCITDTDRAKAGLELLIAARELFKTADNKRTAERCRLAISSAKGAVRIQASRRVRAEIAENLANRIDCGAYLVVTFAHDPERCPSDHWNRGDDVCADCGTVLA